MSRLQQNPLLRMAFTVFASLLLLILLIMSSSLWITFDTQDDAKRINISGSLRMQSYFISQALLRLDARNPVSLDDFRQAISLFEQRFYSPVMVEILALTPSDRQRQTYLEVQQLWKQLKAKLASIKGRPSKRKESELLQDIDQFVSKINQMVYLFQASTEHKVARLMWIHGLGIAAIVLISLLALQRFYRRIVIPLADLSDATARAQTGALDVRVSVGADDELGRLGRAFNHMAESLEKSHNALAKREQEKTYQLNERTQTLELLYESSRMMNLSQLEEGDIDTILDKLDAMVGAGQFCLQLSSFAYQQLRERIQQKRLIVGQFDDQQHDAFTISDDQQVYGKLLWLQPREHKNASLSYDQRQLIAAICDQLAAGLGQVWQNEQTWRLLLVEERATIARELHDSLAQALSYMKIQVSRWQKLSRNHADQARLDKQAQDIRETLNSAYAQLRELLTTFRLKVDEPGLQAALQATLAEYKERGEIQVILDLPEEEISCRPGSEIHIIQIVREALSNVVRHAHATSARVSIKILKSKEQPILRLRIEDDGVGLPEGDMGPDHHGLNIMRERAKNLDASISIYTPKIHELTHRYKGVCIECLCPLSNVVARDSLLNDKALGQNKEEIER